MLHGQTHRHGGESILLRPGTCLIMRQEDDL